MAFVKAVKHQAKLRLALAGPAGSGKTYTALMLASALAGEGGVAVIDTERGSASKYADLFSFDVLELDDFSPERYVEAIREAAQAGYGAVVVDSLSHAWNGTNGILEQVEAIAKRKYQGNSFRAWGDVKPIENRLVETLTGSPLHVIATMRSKTEYVVEQGANGKSTPRKVGTAPVQRDGFEYEFDVFGEMTQDNELIVQKTRCPALTGQVIVKPGAPLAATLKTWLGGAPAPAAAVVNAPALTEREYEEQRTTISVLGDFAAQHRRELPPATEKQITAIGKLLESLGKPPLDGVLTYEQAREMLAQLSGEFQRARRAPTGGQSSLEGLAVGGKN